MGRIDQLVSEEFARWEQRGRGWRVWPKPVRPEPAFEEFAGYRLAQSQLEVDDGRRPGLLASLFDLLEKKLNPPPPVVPEETVEPEPSVSEEPLTAEFVASLPAKLDVSEEVLSAFLDSLSVCSEPTGFELLGVHENVTLQFAASADDAPVLQRQLGAFFPKIAFTPAQERLSGAWNGNDGVGFIVDFGLAHEFMLSLQTGHGVDPYFGLVSVLNELQRDETAVFQVLLQPVRNTWPGSVWRSVTDANGKALFVNRLNLIPGTKEKLERPLFGVVVRAAAKAESFERSAAIVRDMAYALRSFTRHEGNRLIPLHNEEYDFEAHEEDLICRQSRRSGMLLNRDELVGFVHLPSDEVRATKLRRQRTQTKAAPALSPSGVLLGHNSHSGITTPVYLSAEQRTRHLHIVGASGTGKSTLLFNLIRQDIENGEGVAVLDPHGDLVERILGIIPFNRIEDVVLVDPSDEEYSVGFNILHAHSNLERTLLASDLVSVFRRLATSWGDQMDAVLKNAILAFLTSSRRGTLADLRRFLLEPDFRADYLSSVQDPEIVYYWQRGFPLLAGSKSVGPIITRLNDFLATATIRCMVSQTENRLDFAGIMDTGKIFLAKLPAGLVGEKDCHLLGALLVSKFQQVAMSRQAQQVAARRDFWMFADEFDNFITPSMAEILKGTRKYRVGLTLAHHELHQLQRDPDVASAVLSNTSTRIVFRVGDEDARKLSEGFASFEARDLQNLGTGEAIARVERSDFDFNLTIPLPQEPDAATAADVRNRAITASREKYARPRMEVEAELRQQFRTLERDRISERPRAKAKPREPDVVESKAVQIPAPTVPEVISPPVTPAVHTSPPASIPDPKPSSEIAQPTGAPVAGGVETAAAVKPPVEQAAEVRNQTVSEEKEAPALPPEVAPEHVADHKATLPHELGRGGEQHKSIQERLQTEANKLGFTAAVESQLAGHSLQAADLVLRKGKLALAVEISVTTTTNHEFRNVKKCLAAGFDRVAVVSAKPKKLEDIAAAVRAGLGPEQAAKVGYFTPDELIAELKQLSAQAETESIPPAPKERVSRGYKVRRSGPQLSSEERRPKEDIAIRVVAAVMSESQAPPAPATRRAKS